MLILSEKNGDIILSLLLKQELIFIFQEIVPFSVVLRMPLRLSVS